MSEHGYSHWLDDDTPTPQQPGPAIQPENLQLVEALHQHTNLDDISAPAEHDFLDSLTPQNDITPVAGLPENLANRDQDMTLKPRFKGHAPLNAMVRKDWIKAIEASRDNFDALLFRPDPHDVGEIDEETGVEGPSFTELNNNQRDLLYTDPELVKVLDCPDERDAFQAVDSDGEQDGLGDEIQLLRIASEGVSVGSILTWNEEMASGKQVQRWWYVHRIFSHGTQHVGSIYYCIPARNLDSTKGGEVN